MNTTAPQSQAQERTEWRAGASTRRGTWGSLRAFDTDHGRDAGGMLLIWSGWGILVLPVVVGTSVAVGGLGVLALRAAGHPELTFLAVSLGLFAAAVATWLLGRRLDGTPPRELVDPATNERVQLRRRHALFWVPVRYWSVPVGLAALVPLLALRNP